MKKIVFILILNAVLCSAEAQGLIPMGEWRTHYNYQETHLVEEVNGRVFATTQNSILVYDSTDGLSSISSADGLNDVQISALKFDSDKQLLAIGYQNGNLDIISGSDVHNNPILLESTIIDNKKINDISFYENTLNVSTEFGVMVIDLETDIVIDSYRNLGTNGEKIAVHQSVFDQDLMYLATAQGVLMADRTSAKNLQDFNNWERFEGSLVEGQMILSVVFFEQRIYAAMENGLVSLIGDQWIDTVDFLEPDEVIVKLNANEFGIIIITDMGAYNLDELGVISNIPLEDMDQPTDMLQLTEGTYWYAEANMGLSRWMNEETERFVLNGPYSNIEKLKFVNGQLLAFPKLDQQTSLPSSNDLGYSVFDQGSWVNRSKEELLGFDNISNQSTIGDNEYLSSYGQGVLNVTTGILFDESNSTLQIDASNTDDVLVTGMDSDQKGNLWMANPGDFPLHRLSIEGTWQKFDFSITASQEPKSLRINRYGDIWMSLGLDQGAGVLAYDPETEVSRYMSSSNSGLPSNTINDIRFDLEDEIWFATNNGVVYLPFSYGVIENTNINVIRPAFEDGYLFRNRKVTNLEIDPGNRKWMGTKEGLWLFEDNGSALVHAFNKSNSGLPSNNILDIAIDPNTGEVFVSTDLGIVSFRSDATTGIATFQNVKIFPNPVLPKFTGLVGFDGLAKDANIKITTVSGRLVREINAAGGGASWDVADYNGRRVNAGVYLIFSTTDNGEETYVGKIAVIN